MDKYGLDFSLTFNDNGKYLVDLSLFPISKGKELRESPTFSSQFEFENEIAILEKIDEIHNIAKQQNTGIDLFIQQNSLEETILFSQGKYSDYSVKHIGSVKRREVQEISERKQCKSHNHSGSRNRGFLGRKKNSYKYPKGKKQKTSSQQNNKDSGDIYFEKSKNGDIKFIRGDISEENYFFIDLDVNYHSFLKTYEIQMKGFSNFKKLEKSHSLFDSSIFFQNTHRDSAEMFLDFALPHIKYNQSRGKNICLYSTHKSLQFINILNQALKKEGLEPIIVRLKTKELSEKEILMSQQRIEDNMKDTYKELQNLEDKHVVYCDGAHFSRCKLISGAFIFRENGWKDFGDNKFERIAFNDERSSDQAELVALREALKFIDKKGKNDKPIHFVFDSDFVFKNLNCIIEGQPTFEQTLYQDEFKEITDIIQRNNLTIKSVVLKSHQFGEINPDFKDVVDYNEKVDKLTKRNFPKSNRI